MQEVNYHPRPDFKRTSWMDLNGMWEFKFDHESDFDINIKVPYVYQSQESGVNDPSIHKCVWYQRRMSIPKQASGKQYILHFGAVDYQTWVWVNDIFIGIHRGGYSSFQMDITHAVQEENTILVKVKDDYYNSGQVRGKQMWQQEDYGCWYKGYTGIWQPVWLELVDRMHIEHFRMTPDIEKKLINFSVKISEASTNINLKASIFYKGRLISGSSYKGNCSIINFSQSVNSPLSNFNGIELWTPESPNLYDISLELYEDADCKDVVTTYCGLRQVAIRDNKVLLNHIPYYQKLVLDQGYYEGGYISAKSDEDFIKDIQIIKEMGFNGVRKHQKIEDPRFLYWCDRLGLLVWEEMPSYYQFHEDAVSAYMEELLSIVKRDYNHPCIITWVTYNESWGIFDVLNNKQQQDAVHSAYYTIKALDPTRPVIGNDGWEQTVTDICTIHDYEQDGKKLDIIYNDKERCVNGAPSTMFPRMIQANGHTYRGQPVIVSEFAGIAFSGKAGWGYGESVQDEDEYIGRLSNLVNALKTKDYLCGYCITQLTDVEHETNGLLYFNRTPKVSIEKIREIIK